MSSRTVLPLVAACLATSAVYASTGCDDTLTQSFHECVRIVDSLRPDKAGQARVFASNGAEFTAGQADWMKGQLKLVDKACARGDQTEAARLLVGVQDLIKAHARGT
jgi:hypothetical protein